MGDTTQEELERRVEKHSPPFEPGLPPSNVHNREAAKARHLRYDARARVYRDSDGCPVRDGYGQRLG
ncbi:hypothetical protein HZB90_04270 [archaeon]|nr:hypothetical protein [archaeon]